MKIDKEKFDILVAERMMSYQDVAIDAGVSDKTINRIKHGQSLRPNTIGRIA